MAAERAERRESLFLWAPVFFGLGAWAHIGGAGPHPPVGAASLAAAGAAALIGGAALRIGSRAGRCAAALALALIAAGLVSLGYSAALSRASHVAAPVWPPQVSGDWGETRIVSGRVRAVLRGPNGGARLVLDRLSLPSAPERFTPARVRLSASAGSLAAAERAAADVGARLGAEPLLGVRLTLRAALWSPPGPAEPGAYDFRRRAWFEEIGALGRIRWVLGAAVAAPAEGWRERAALAVAGARAIVAARVREALPGQEGELAAALLVGDRSGLDETVLEALRASNLAHLLAISGLHMGLVCLTVFGAARFMFALAPAPPRAMDPKKLAALLALAAGAVYLLLSGAAPPAQRAYVMAAVAFGAVLLDRSAITLRAVAIAALVILLAYPESVVGVSFQLSFAAVTAMVAAFAVSRPFWRSGARRAEEAPGLAARWTLWLAYGAGALALSSLVAGLATAPFAAEAFNRLTRYGLLANLLAVPIMGFWVMPSGVAAALLAPVGLEGVGLSAMGAGISVIVTWAQWVSSLPGATLPVAAPPPGALSLVALGGLMLCLFQAPWRRGLGAAVLAAGALLWPFGERPQVLIAPEGRLIGVLAAPGAASGADYPHRALDRPERAESFVATLWSRRDGGPPGGYARPPGDAGFTALQDGRTTAPLPGDWRIVRIAGAAARALAPARCPPRTLIVAPSSSIGDEAPADARSAAAGGGPASALQRRGAAHSPPCLIIDQDDLSRSGSLAIWLGDAATGAPLRVRSAADAAGRRYWTDPSLRAALFARRGDAQ